MTQMPEATSLLPHYQRWMIKQRRSAQTIDRRMIVLRKADRELPYGLDDASEDEIFDWLSHYTSPWTVATYDNHLRGYYTWAVKYGHLSPDPMADLARPGPGPRIPHPCTDAELALALTAPAMPWRRAVRLGAYAGLRCAEMCRATTDDIVQGVKLRVYGKGGRWRLVPLHPVLQRELDGTPAGHLIVSQRMGRPINPRLLTQYQRAVWRRLGLSDRFSLHSLRHWCLSAVRRAGGLLPAQRVGGHATPDITTTYTETGDDELADVVSLLPVILPEGTEPDGSRLGRPQAA